MKNDQFIINSYQLPFISLQWFADSDDEDAPGKTEQPTERKIQRLREEGQVVKSQELVSALGLFVPALLILFMAPFILRSCVELVMFFFTRAVEMDPIQDRVVVMIFFRYFAILAGPILLIAFVTAVFSNIVQTGLLFTTKPLTPNFSRVVPRIGKFFKRIFSVDGLWNFAKSIIKMLIVGSVSFVMIFLEREKLLNLQKTDLFTGFTLVTGIAIKMMLFASLLMIVFGIIDFFFQRWRFRERNKMTRYEIKEELKMSEADPQVQGRIRARFRDLLRQNIMAAVPQADVVVTNPTHLAIALQYDSQTMPGPRVTAIGADEMSARIREIAQDNEVPLVENKALAWALYRETNVGDIIPVAYWNTVAVILSRVWRLNEERRRRLSA